MTPAAPALAAACWPGGLTRRRPAAPGRAAAGRAHRRRADDRPARAGPRRPAGAGPRRRAAAGHLGQPLRRPGGDATRRGSSTQLGDAVDLILDGGPAAGGPRRPSSTARARGRRSSARRRRCRAEIAWPRSLGAAPASTSPTGVTAVRGKIAAERAGEAGRRDGAHVRGRKESAVMTISETRGLALELDRRGRSRTCGRRCRASAAASTTTSSSSPARTTCPPR